MPTPFKVIEDRFKRLITDPFYAELLPEDASDDINNLIMANACFFEFPKQSLDFDEETKSFDNDLTTEEIAIISFLCLEAWLAPFLFDTDLIRLQFGDKDFKLSGQAAQIAQVNALLDSTIQRRNAKMKFYNRRTTAGRPNYAGLAGGAI